MDISAVRLTDEEMDDPELLAELAAVTGMSVEGVRGVEGRGAEGPSRGREGEANTCQRRDELVREASGAKMDSLAAKKSGDKVRAAGGCEWWLSALIRDDSLLWCVLHHSPERGAAHSPACGVALIAWQACECAIFRS